MSAQNLNCLVYNPGFVNPRCARPVAAPVGLPGLLRVPGRGDPRQAGLPQGAGLQQEDEFLRQTRQRPGLRGHLQAQD